MFAKMNSDWFLRTGSTHKMCEDYALTNDRFNPGNPTAPGPIIGTPFAILADGCSSSPHTDFGARLLSASVRHIVREFPHLEPVRVYLSAWRAALAATQSLHLPLDSLDTTLGMVQWEKSSGTWKARWLGDGVIATLQ